MKKAFLLITIYFLASCCHSPNSANFSEVRTDMAGLNKRLRGYYFNNVKEDLSDLNQKQYLLLATAQQDQSEKEYFDFLTKENPEIKFKSFKTDFIVCIKAIKAAIVICDRASTALTDFDSVDTSLDLDKLIENLSNR